MFVELFYSMLLYDKYHNSLIELASGPYGVHIEIYN